MLSVKQFKKRVRRTTEKAFESLFAEVLGERNIYSRHMSDRFSGVPDRYVASGKWVELKSLEYARGDVPYGAGMTVEQKRVCGDLLEADEEVWYLALITTSKGQYVIFCPMHFVLGEPGNVFDCHGTAKADYGWVSEYEGKATIRKLIPKDWYI